jgi:predicted PurR-regulated permease PerM
LAVIETWSLEVAGTSVPVGSHINELLTERVMAIPASLPSIVVGAIHGFLHVLAFLITSFFLMMNGKQVARTLVNLVPKIHQTEVRYVGSHINGILRGYIRGTLLLIPIMAVLTTIALWLLGVRYALLIGIVSGVVEILPIIGPWSAAAFAIIMAVFQSPLPFGDTVFMVSAVIGGVYFALRMFEDYVIIPAVVGPAVHLHPILVIAAILAGAEIGGILGLFLAIPFMSVMQYMLRWVYHKLVSSDTLPDGH